MSKVQGILFCGVKLDVFCTTDQDIRSPSIVSLPTTEERHMFYSLVALNNSKGQI